jgi:nucleoside-diphosphate-sugar epimerase
MKVLITGLTGFIGRNLAAAIVHDGFEIVTVSRRESPSIPLVKPGNIFKGNLNDKESLRAAFQGVDVVVNIAAELKNEADFMKTNVLGVQNIIDLASEYGVKKIVHLSSVGVVGMQYSSSPVVVDENSVCRPKNNYEITKLESEKLLLETWSSDASRLSILRPTNVFGELHPRNALLNFISSVKNGRKYYATRTAMVNYVYVNDVVQSLRKFIRTNGKHCVYNVGTAGTFTDFLNATANALEVVPRLTYVHKGMFKLANGLNLINNSSVRSAVMTLSNEVQYSDARLRKEFPEIASVSFEQAMKNTVADYKTRKLLQ